MSTPSMTQKDAYRVMLKDYPDIMNIVQMCEVLGISTKTGYKILKEEKIVSLRIGRTYRIPKVHILSYLQIGSNLAAQI